MRVCDVEAYREEQHRHPRTHERGGSDYRDDRNPSNEQLFDRPDAEEDTEEGESRPRNAEYGDRSGSAQAWRKMFQTSASP